MCLGIGKFLFSICTVLEFFNSSLFAHFFLLHTVLWLQLGTSKSNFDDLEEYSFVFAFVSWWSSIVRSEEQGARNS
jgi:hypothetical protein